MNIFCRFYQTIMITISVQTNERAADGQPIMPSLTLVTKVQTWQKWPVYNQV